MPATTSPVSSVDFYISAEDSSVGGGTGGTLTVNRSYNDAYHDQSARWMGKTPSTRSWSLACDALYLTDAASVVPGSSLNVTVGGVALKGLTEISASMSLATAEVVNSTTGLDRSLDPGARSLSLSVSSDYYDPAGTGATALDAVFDELAGDTDGGLAIVFTVGGVSVSFNGRPSQATVGKSVGEILKAGLTLDSDGPVTATVTGTDTGIAALFASFFADGAATALDVRAATADNDNTEWSGQAFPSSLSLTAPLTGDATISATFEGHGPLNRTVTSGVA